MTPRVSLMVRNLSAVRETWVRSLGWEDPLEKGKAPTPVFLPGDPFAVSVESKSLKEPNKGLDLNSSQAELLNLAKGPDFPASRPHLGSPLCLGFSLPCSAGENSSSNQLSCDPHWEDPRVTLTPASCLYFPLRPLEDGLCLCWPPLFHSKTNSTCSIIEKQ